MNQKDSKANDVEDVQEDTATVVVGDFFHLRIEEHESHMGLDPEPSNIDLKFTIEDDDGREVEFVAMGCEVEEILKGINTALAAKLEREQEMDDERERDELIEELLESFETERLCQIQYLLRDHLDDLQCM